MKSVIAVFCLFGLAACMGSSTPSDDRAMKCQEAQDFLNSNDPIEPNFDPEGQAAAEAVIAELNCFAPETGPATEA